MYVLSNIFAAVELMILNKYNKKMLRMFVSIKFESSVECQRYGLSISYILSIHQIKYVQFKSLTVSISN